MQRTPATRRQTIFLSYPPPSLSSFSFSLRRPPLFSAGDTSIKTMPEAIHLIFFTIYLYIPVVNLLIQTFLRISSVFLAQIIITFCFISILFFFMPGSFYRILEPQAISAFQGPKTGAKSVFLHIKSGTAPVSMRKIGSKINPDEIRQNNRRLSSIHPETRRAMEDCRNCNEVRHCPTGTAAVLK